MVMHFCRGVLGSLYILVCLVTSTYAAHTAKEITQRYYNTARDCGGANLPAFLCSGVLLRGTEDNKDFHSWDPSPQAQKDGGISFIFLRKDAKFSKIPLHYKNGYIFYPEFSSTKPKEKICIEYLCAFPLDGNTDARFDNGCGMRKKDPHNRARPCQSIDIFTGEQWVDKYGNDRMYAHEACGFTVAHNSKPPHGTAKAFLASLKAGQLLGKKAFEDWNEIVVKTWPPNMGKNLPIEAFFYVKKYGYEALQGARNDQKDLYNTEGIWVPIIALTLPKSISDDATFHYYEDDQAVYPL